MAVAERELTSQSEVAAEEQTAKDWTPQPYRWTREEFCEMGEAGLFEQHRVILMEGEIIAMPPMKPPHQTAVSLGAEAVRTLFGAGFFVREQGPFNVGSASDPEPDIAVIAGGVRDFVEAHPTAAALIIEISNATLAYDRREKASLYAKAGILDYWIINPKQNQVEVHRQPAPDAAQPFGYGYGEVTIHGADAVIQPLAAPQPVAAASLLP